jgi:anti-sigma factor RsiW
MNHLPFEILDALLDEQLTPSERADARAHLVACADCRAELDARRQLFAALDALADDPLAVDLAPRVLAQIEPMPRAWWIAALIVAETVAAIALAVWLGETLVPLFDLLPDFGATLTAIQQAAMDALNAINIEPLETVPLDGLALGVAIVAWLLTNWLLIQFPKQKEVLV